MLDRLRVMRAGEVLGHIRRRLYALADATAMPAKFAFPLKCSGRFPIPKVQGGDATSILSGQWNLMHGIVLNVDNPPRWQKDYLAGLDLWTDASSFRLDHRQLPGGADIKMIWDLNRWTHLVTLAAAGHADVVFQWLEDWLVKNRAFKGWNWTSALETGIRLLNFCWIDAYLRPGHAARMDDLASRILPAHAHFTWRYRSFGSSGNNHRMGELAGLIVAVARWPELSKFCIALPELQHRWEHEVLAQFAPDGGNREQALHYHWFSLELCRQARAALAEVSPAVLERLALADYFFAQLHVDEEPWDYGDSDDAEMIDARPAGKTNQGWRFFVESGYAMFRSPEWILRWDVSPLGYLAIAAHGHLDALHISIWHRGHALVIDPGTGAYYTDTELRAELAGWTAHNGPHPLRPATPRQLGTFLWADHHAKPDFDEEELSARLGAVRRTVNEEKAGWLIEDESEEEFEVIWQFAPSVRLIALASRSFRLEQAGQSFSLSVSDSWSSVEPMKNRCSPSFRRVTTSAALRLVGRGRCTTKITVE